MNITRKISIFGGFFAHELFFLNVKAMRKTINNIQRFHTPFHPLKMAALLGLMLLVGNAWGQDNMPLDHVPYYIEGPANGSGYNAGNLTTHYYLCPTENWKNYNATNNTVVDDSTGMPFVTTYQCLKSSNNYASLYGANKAIWVFEKQSGTNYRIKNVGENKYLTSHIAVLSNQGRMRLHLQATTSDGALFTLTDHTTHYRIKANGNVSDGYSYVNVNKGNKPYLDGNGENIDNIPTGGILGTYNKNSSDEHFNFYIRVHPDYVAPTINTVDATHYTITPAITLPEGYSIRYTKDGSLVPSPTNGTPYTLGDEIVITTTCTLRAWMVGTLASELDPAVSTPVMSLVASQYVDLGVPTPTFAVLCENELEISCPGMEVDSIYYSIDDSDPTGAAGTRYTAPFTSGLTDGCTVYAVAYLDNVVSNEVADTIYHPNTEGPVITLPFEMTALISFVTGATLYYTTNGNDPDTLDLVGTGTTKYTGPSPLTITPLDPAEDLHIRAIAKLSGRGASCPVVTLKRPKWPGYTVVHDCVGGERVHMLTITTQSNRTYWYALKNGSGQQAPSESEFIQYTGQAVDITTIPGYDGSEDVTLHLFAKDADNNKSAVRSVDVSLSLNGYTALPTITFDQNSGTVTITDATANATIYYTVDGGSESNHSSPVTINNLASGQTHTITAWAQADGLGSSCTAVLTVSVPTTITTLQQLKDMASNGAYLLGNNITGAGSFVTISMFSGYFDGGGHTITGLTQPLFDTVDGGVVKNVALKKVAISSSADTVGAIACKAMGYSRIYNCGILPDTAAFPQGTHPSVTTEGNCAGGLVGSLRDNSRVINCYSYADVQATNTASGIVGYNAFASTAEETGGRYTKLRTAVVNCMFYGDINGGTNQYGVYGGQLIANNAATGISSYNYFRNGSKFTAANGHPNINKGSKVVGNPTSYNCSFPADERYLTQVEFHRSLLNSNRELCGWWVGSDVAPSTLTTAQVQAIPKDASLIYKWVVDPNIAPYPILKPFGKYPSIVNGNTGTPWFDRTTANPYEGKQLGTLTVTVKSGSHSLAGDKTRYIHITDMDTLHYDFGYRKVQLPYYNTVFGDPDGANWEAKYACNYTDSVVTGWKVTAVDHEGDSAFVANWEHGYNFAERKCTDKDIYSNSNPRVFAQGGNYYVPDGVSAITIEAYWGKAIYVCDADSSYDRVNITVGTAGTHFAPAGTRPNKFNGRTVNTGMIRDVIDNITVKKTVYDHAIVLVGNVQESNGNNAVTVNTDKTIGFTIMSVDLDFDEEPDYCLEWQLGTGTTRNAISPVRFDFLPVVELGIAGKLHNSTNFFSLGCFRSCGHFEVTETAFIRFGQFEFERKTRDNGPIILNGGIFDQYTRGTAGDENTNNVQHITYIILGGHVVMPSFTPGAHVNGGANYATRHCAVNALGGDFSSFYLTGGYNENVTPYNDNPHCYIDGGRFGTIAAAYKEGITGNVFWRINHALIGEFYGGGMMSDDNKVVKGNIDVVIDNSIVGKYCGGPKFGNMMEGKTVTTSATGTTFYHFYGAGNGGTNYVQFANDDKTDGPRILAQWLTLLNGKYSPKTFINTAKGYHANFDYEEINPSTGTPTSGSIDRIYYYSAQFATTNTGDITSTLTNCIVKNNFYGAGFLGGVNGKVESTLIDCTVQGSVFGAGYSASVPKVNIYNTDRTPPTANTYTGLITPQSGGTYKSYTWCDTVGTTGSPVTYDTLFYTDISLDNLGAVSNNVTLTLKGNTTVGTFEGPSGSQTLKAGTGNVFGGGDQSAVEGNTSVNIQEGTTVHGNVYGGGNEGPVGGNSEVKIQDD